MEKKIARCILTTQCNLKCDYCCNRIPSIQQSFKFTTMDQFIEISKNYTDINISGGEPMLAPEKLRDLVEHIHHKSDARIWLYTNGTICPNIGRIGDLPFDGVNIGIHDNFGVIKKNVESWNGCANIKVHVQRGHLTSEIDNFCMYHDIPIKLWELDNCNNTQEDRFII